MSQPFSNFPQDTDTYIAELEEKYNTLVEFNNKGREAYEELAKDYDQLADEFDEVQEQRRQAADDLRQLAGHYSDLERRYDELVEQQDSMAHLQQSSELDEEIAEKESQRDKLTQQVVQLEDIQKTLAAEITELEEYQKSLQQATPEYAEGLHDFILALEAMHELTSNEQTRSNSRAIFESSEPSGRHSKQ